MFLIMSLGLFTLSPCLTGLKGEVKADILRGIYILFCQLSKGWFAIFHSFTQQMFLCFYQVPSTVPAAMNTVSLPTIGYCRCLEYRCFCCLLTFQIKTSCEYSDVFLSVFKFSTSWWGVVPLNIKVVVQIVMSHEGGLWSKTLGHKDHITDQKR